MLHKFAKSAKKRNTSWWRVREGVNGRWPEEGKKRGREGRLKKCRQKGSSRMWRQSTGGQAILHTRCINRNKFQWMPKHFPPIFFRRSTYHTPKYLRERYTGRFIFSRASRAVLTSDGRETCGFPHPTKRRNISRLCSSVYLINLT